VNIYWIIALCIGIPAGLLNVYEHRNEEGPLGGFVVVFVMTVLAFGVAWPLVLFFLLGAILNTPINKKPAA